MNKSEIETLLQKAPSIPVPAGLRERLQREVNVPRVNTERTQTQLYDPASWLRRWLPAVSFAAFFFACLVAIGVQTNLMKELKHENADLRAAARNLEPLRAANQEYKRLLAQSRELEGLRQDNADLQRLRSEAVQMRGQMAELQKLRVERQRLQAELASRPEAAGTNGDFFAEAKLKAERIQCLNNLKQIGLAARVWAGDNNGAYPTNFICMTNELANWKVLQCPGDKSHNVTNWADVATGNVSYQLLAPTGTTENIPNVVFARCPIHGSVVLVDGSVQMIGPELEKHLKVHDGVTVFEP